MCDKAANTNYSTTQFVPDCYKTKKCMIKLLINVFLVFFVFLINIKLKKYVTENFWRSFIIILLLYCPHKCKTQRMCYEAVEDCLAALKFIPNWFDTSKMIKKFSLIRTASFSIYKNIVRLLTWHSKYEKRKALKK